MADVALVTGGSRGIGRATVARLLKEGWTVAFNYHSDDAAGAQVTALAPERCVAYRCDVIDEAAVNQMVADVVNRFGPISLLVNNAGIWRGGPIERVSLEDFRRVLDVALVGNRNCSVAVLDGMRKLGFGHIINVSSAVALVGWRGDVAYTAAKAGIIGVTRAMAKELAQDGIRVNVVVPGFIETDMTNGVPEQQRRRLLSRGLLGRPGTAEDIAGVIYGIAAEGAYMTGSVVVVDGGFVLGRDDPLVLEELPI